MQTALLAFLRFCLDKPAAVVLTCLGLAVYGAFCLVHLPLDALPDITNKQIQVNIEWPEATATTLDSQACYRLETAFKGLNGLEQTRSLSRPGFSQITAIYAPSCDLTVARAQILERIQLSKGDLPESCHISLSPPATGLGEVVMWTVQSKKEAVFPTELARLSFLREQNDFIVQPAVSEVKGLAAIDSLGGVRRSYTLNLDPAQLEARNLEPAHVVETLREHSLSRVLGRQQQGGKVLVQEWDARLKSEEDVTNAILSSPDTAVTRLGELGKLELVEPARMGSASVDGRECVIGTALMRAGENSREVAAGVEAKLASVAKNLDPRAELAIALTRSDMVNRSVQTAFTNLGEGALLVVLSLFVLLGHWRVALLAACILPLSMLFAAIWMKGAHISASLMSLGAIDFGLLVDAAIIVSENYLRKLSPEDATSRTRRLQLAFTASKEMLVPSLFGQLIIMLVYVPVLSLEGVEGKMFVPMAATVLFCLASAFVLSFSLVPVGLAFFVKRPSTWHFPLPHTGYERFLTAALKMRKTVLLTSCAVLAVSVWVFGQLGVDFLPTLEEGSLAVHAMRIPATSLPQAQTMQAELETALLQVPGVKKVFSKTGTADLASDPMPVYLSDTFITLNDPARQADVLAAVREVCEKLPGNAYEFTQPVQMRFNELLTGHRSPVVVKIFGGEAKARQEACHLVEDLVKGTAGADDVKAVRGQQVEVQSLMPKSERLATLGLSKEQVVLASELACKGILAGQLSKDDRSYPIYVRTQGGLEAARVKIDNAYMPLSEVAAFKPLKQEQELRRENAQAYASVGCAVVGRDLGSFCADLEGKLEKASSQMAGLRWMVGGQIENLRSASSSLQLISAFCLLGIAALLVTAFGQVRAAVSVLLALPFALCGGVFALYLRGMDFSISAAIGLIAVSGIAMLNALVLTTKMEEEGSLVSACSSRLRPVLTTAFVAILGLFPMALSTSAGAEVQRPLATVVIGGLISATLMTLLVLPCVSSLLRRQKAPQS